MNYDKAGMEERGSLFFALTRETLNHPASERKRHFIYLCFQHYREEVVGREYLTFEKLFPFAQLEDSIHNSFLHPTVKDRVSAWISELKSSLERLYRSLESGNSLDETDINATLMAYYRLYWGVLKDTDMLMGDLNELKDPQGRERQGYVFLRTLLNLGCSFQPVGAKHIVGMVSPFAPRYLSAILETASLLAGLDTEEAKGGTGAELEILNTFVSRFLRWYLVAQDGVLCHAAARPVSSFPQERNNICLMIRPVSDYSSYEGVSELRLFEKIRYEMEQRAASQKGGGGWGHLHILIVGDIDADEIIKLGWMLEGWLEHGFAQPAGLDAKITFLLFTDNCSFDPQVAAGWPKQMEQFRWLRMERYPMAELFGNREILERQADQADLLFFLDCQQMYRDFYAVPYPDLSAFFQQTAELSGDAVHRSASGHVLSPNSPFLQVQNLLLGSLYGHLGPALLKKKVGTAWLNYIGARLKSQNKTAYFYYSDLNAAQNLYWREDCFVRSEDYAGKRMVILRYSGNTEQELRLAQNNRKKIIVFNLWQFIKHCNLRRIDVLMDLFGLGSADKRECAKNIWLLSRVLVGIDYVDWPNRLRLTYSYPDTEPLFRSPVFAEQLKWYMENIIQPCFDREKSGIYLSYFRKCIASFLPSSANSVDDMLFIHIFKRHFCLLRSISLKQEKNYGKLDGIRLNGIKYSGKRFYQEVMNDYDEPTCYVADQYRKLALMEESGGLRPEDVFRNVLTACKRNQYSESNLYHNCSKWLEDNDCAL